MIIGGVGLSSVRGALQWHIIQSLKEYSMLDDALLEEFMHGFYGYGSYFGDIWLIGKEEGGVNSCIGIAERLRAWNERGRQVLEDVAAFHNAIGEEKYFTDNPEEQPTWRGLIQILCGFEGLDPTKEFVNWYQSRRLGRITDNHALLEFLPLPCKSTKPEDWFYPDCTSLPYLATRKKYCYEVWDKRIAQLKVKIRYHKPRAVVFYSKSRHYLGAWRDISGGEFVRDDNIGVLKTVVGNTTFLITDHPTAWIKGSVKDYFYSIGESLR